MHWGMSYGMGSMMVWWWVFWGLVIGGVVWVVLRGGRGRAGGTEESPETTLKRRYARGDIDREEYERRLTDLRR